MGSLADQPTPEVIVFPNGSHPIVSGGRAALLAVLTTCVADAHAQDPADAWTVSPEQIQAAWAAPLFQSEDVLEFTLHADFNTLRRRDRHRDAPERDATLTYTRPDGSEVRLALTLQTRGKWRLDPSNCRFPNLWLDFDREDAALAGTIFEGQNRLKLYVTCRPGRDDYERYNRMEYVIYPAYNALTDASFRARLARVTYEDTSGEDDTFTSNAFLLEHKDPMAARSEAVPLEVEQQHPATVQQEAAALMEIFQYMVGMTDWNAVTMHNVEPMRRMDGAILLVGYDYDWSGTVDARYASPNEALGIRSVRQRIFQGFCREVDYAAVFARFNEHRAEMLQVVRDFGALEENHRNRIIDYWEDFFEMSMNPRRHDRILRDCMRMPS